MTEIIFEVTEDEVDSGYSASALGHGIHTQGNSVEEIRSNVKGIRLPGDSPINTGRKWA